MCITIARLFFVLSAIVSLVTTPASARISRRAGNGKAVVAHFMVGNTYPYGVSDWLRDIQLAASKGIDAFALNLGRDPWQPARIADAFTAAKSAGGNFKLFLSFDMTSLPCVSPGDANLIQQYMANYTTLPTYFVFKGKPLVSTFAGEYCTFGQGGLDAAWNYAIKSRSIPAVNFVPSFFVDPSQYPSLRSVDGAFNWNGAWPMGGNDLDFSSDQGYISNLGGRIYMAPVSPWFFAHYGPNSYNKNWIYRPDNWLFAARWEMLFDHRSAVDIVQIISWNDYGESHYVGPIEGAQPMSESWVNGFDHQGWLDLISYYASAFTAGVYPSIISDRMFLWGRLAPRAANTNDLVGKPTRWDLTEDTVWGVVHLASPALVTIACGTSNISYNLPKGRSKMKLPLTKDCDVTGRIVRGKTVAVDFRPTNYHFTTRPTSYNFNAFVAASVPSRTRADLDCGMGY
ncbi:glycoside hydrolase family 71 protein [Cylindrobasidium torrendii FP15055 ss-10]|uniref:Glycoside hydrolase family 71 protein n=1 Tax=Cylindrobasidium torrendii FP15055 ss-10 TaxID=1314674 RepID=A0A0D7BEI4_9AGAR|nr:glycoside hydrolase family 71 protein [Cylindrobasidium torrendii FP15055 ss-10]